MRKELEGSLMEGNTMGKDLIPRNTGEILQDTIQALAEGITGLAATEKKGLILSIGRIFQSIRGGRLLSQLHNEWNAFRDEGRIKDDYQFTEQHQNCLHELLDFLENDIPDKVRFEVIKKIFLVAATEELEPKDSVLPHYYMRICKQLSSGAVLVLLTTYRRIEYSAGRPVPRTENLNNWRDWIAGESGLKHRGLVELYDKELENLQLLRPAVYDTNTSIAEHDRLTELGYSLCSFIEAYEEP